MCRRVGFSYVYGPAELFLGFLVAAEFAQSRPEIVARSDVTGVKLQRILVALHGLVVRALSEQAVSFSEQRSRIAPGRPIGRPSPRARRFFGQSHQQRPRQLINDLRLNALLEQSPFEGVGKLRSPEHIQAQGSGFAVYPLQEPIKNLLKLLALRYGLGSFMARGGGAWGRLQYEVVG
jgi:hypothetical protein